MVRAIAGEVSLRVGCEVRRLRLEIGAILDLEDYFGMGLVPLLRDRLPDCRLGDLSALLVAMTGGDPADNAARELAAREIHEAGFISAAKAIGKCLELTFMGGECPPVTDGNATGKKPRGQASRMP